MKRKLNTFCAPRRATTLIEVLAGLVILSTILAVVLVARGRFVRQQVLAQHEMQAIQSLDQLVAQWMRGTTPTVPFRGSGTLPGSINQTWRTLPINDPHAQNLGAQIVRVEVFDPIDRGPIVMLDLILHIDAPSEGRS